MRVNTRVFFGFRGILEERINFVCCQNSNHAYHSKPVAILETSSSTLTFPQIQRLLSRQKTSLVDSLQNRSYYHISLIFANNTVRNMWDISPPVNQQFNHLRLKQIQSTLPRRERREIPYFNSHAIHFNPRSRVGSDVSRCESLQRRSHFNPRSRVGSDRICTI